MPGNDSHLPHLQKNTKPKIEDVIPYYLEDDIRQAALDFAAYMRASKMPLKWASANRWKALYKGEVICWVELLKQAGCWEISPCLKNINEYEEFIINEGWQSNIWDNVAYCRLCNPARECARGKSKTILGKDLKGVCQRTLFNGRIKVDFANPDETAINRVKKLLEMERTAKEES